MEGYTLQMLDCLSLHSNSGTNGMLGYSDKSIEKHGKKQEKISQKIFLETPNLNYSIAIHTWTIYGKKCEKCFCSKAFDIFKVLYLMKSSDCKRFWNAVFFPIQSSIG